MASSIRARLTSRAVRLHPALLALALGLAFSALPTACARKPPGPIEHGAAQRQTAGAARAPDVPPPPAAGEESLAQLRFRLLEEQDSDCDQKITKTDQGSRRFRFRHRDRNYELEGHYVLANLLQELSLALRHGGELEIGRVTEAPVERTSRLIRDAYWPALTRRADASGLPRLLEDPKQPRTDQRHIYVAPSDPEALAYFRALVPVYDGAHAKIAEGAVNFPFGDLKDIASSEEKRRVLVAMLRTEEGLAALARALEQLRTLAKSVEYPGLAKELASSLERLRELFDQAQRPCVRSSSARLGGIAERSARELASFSPRRLRVEALPQPAAWVEWTAGLGPRHGPLALSLVRESSSITLGVPYVVPGGRFDEMYGWDSYFILLGLLADQRMDLARGLVDNFVYSIEHYGAILNANRTYYLTRSQPPFMSSMLRAVWEATPVAERSLDWLARGTRAVLQEYSSVWNSPARQVRALCDGEGEQRVCLSRYAGRGKGQPPEVEPGHFDWFWQRLGKSLATSYAHGKLADRNLDAEIDRAFAHDRCMRESGHDTTYRWFWPGAANPAELENRCRDMVTVDLNSLLYRYEIDIAYLLRQLLAGSAGAAQISAKPGPRSAARALELATSAAEPSVWCARARRRLGLMKRHLWSARDGMFYDAFVSDRGPIQTGYVSATALYPLWATALPCELGTAREPSPLTRADASALVTNALRQLEAPGGLLASSRESRERFSSADDRQWDYPNGWAPHQMLAWMGLDAHGFDQDAERLTFAWLYTLLINVIDYNGTIPEKYDVIRRTHAVFAEYGNVGTEFDYITSEGFGWMNASFQVGLARLGPSGRERLAAAVARR